MQVEAVRKNSWRMDEDNIVIGFCHILYIGTLVIKTLKYIYLLLSSSGWSKKWEESLIHPDNPLIRPFLRYFSSQTPIRALRLKADMLLILHALPWQLYSALIFQIFPFAGEQTNNGGGGEGVTWSGDLERVFTFKELNVLSTFCVSVWKSTERRCGRERAERVDR